MSTVLKAAEHIQPGDKIVRTVHHDGRPKRTATVNAVQVDRARDHARYMLTVDPSNDALGWYSATYQFTVEV